MATRWARRLTLAPVAALGLYAVSLGLPLPDSCVASAAPSPSCSGDLRECLRASARQDMFSRWVTAEDVARCMEAFRSCINGGASGGGSPGAPPTTTARRDSGTGLPQRFGINHGYGGVSDCRVEGDSFTCTENWETDTDSYAGEFTGKLSGLTLTGTRTTHRSGHSPADPSCRIDERYSGPVTYVLSPDGTATFTAGPYERQTSLSGSCPGSNSGTTEVMTGTATWSPMQ